MSKSFPYLLRSSSIPRMEGWRKMMLLTTRAWDDATLRYELRSLLARDDVEERLAEVRSVAMACL